MPSPSPMLLVAFQLDATRKTPVYRQLYEQLRLAIMDGRTRPGSRLPASRTLAAELGLSRNTIVTAYNLLADEGYISLHVGAGAYVRDVLPEDTPPPTSPPPVMEGEGTLPPLSARGRQLTALSMDVGSAYPEPFVADVPAFDVFPLDAWSRLMSQSWRHVQPTMLGYADPSGYMPLRDAIAQNLHAARFLKCTAQQVIMTSGSQQSLDLLARILLDPGDPVWIEDPGYIGTRNTFIAAGARLVPVPVDAEGLVVAEGIKLEPAPRLIFITPSRQYPLGMTLSMARRAEILDFAQSCGAWVIEDDYDSEFRYSGTPLPALQSMDRSGRVFYLGTFSKSLLPSFRLGFVVTPVQFVAVLANAKRVLDRHPPLLEQITLLSFIQSGQFAAHIRRMRRIYKERQNILLNEAHQTLGHIIDMQPVESGVHLIGRFLQDVDDCAFCAAAAKMGIMLRPLSLCYLGPEPQSGLIFGFAAIQPRRIVAAMKKLSLFTHNWMTTHPGHSDEAAQTD